MQSWFELADMYTTSMDPEDYVEFLQQTIDTMCVQDDDGGVQWADDYEIIENHFHAERKRCILRSARQLRSGFPPTFCCFTFRRVTA